jgi:hypothetical protein
MNNKIQKHLNFTCSACCSTFQLLEIHEQESQNCSAYCQKQWQTLLSQHYQQQIILHFAQAEAEKEQNHE